MPLVVVDPRMLQHALLFDGERRRLLVLLVLGKLAARAEVPDESLMQKLASVVGDAEIHAPEPVDLDAVEAWRGRLPDGAPSDIVMVGARELLERTTTLVRDSLVETPELYGQAADIVLEPLAGEYIGLPAEASSRPTDEVMLLAGLSGPVDVVVSDHAGDPAAPRAWRGGGRSVVVMTFDQFVESYVEHDGFSLASIDTGVLPEAGRLLSPPGAERARLDE